MAPVACSPGLPWPPSSERDAGGPGLAQRLGSSRQLFFPKRAASGSHNNLVKEQLFPRQSPEGLRSTALWRHTSRSLSSRRGCHPGGPWGTTRRSPTAQPTETLHPVRREARCPPRHGPRPTAGTGNTVTGEATWPGTRAAPRGQARGHLCPPEARPQGQAARAGRWGRKGPPLPLARQAGHPFGKVKFIFKFIFS